MTVSYLFVVCFIVVVCSVDALQVRNSLFLKSRRVQTSSHTVSTTPWHSPLSVTHHHYYTKLRDNQSPVDVSEVVPAHLGGKWRKYDIPNKLTAIRVLCIPLFIAAFTANKVIISYTY